MLKTDLQKNTDEIHQLNRTEKEEESKNIQRKLLMRALTKEPYSPADARLDMIAATYMMSFEKEIECYQEELHQLRREVERLKKKTLRRIPNAPISTSGDHSLGTAILNATNVGEELHYSDVINRVKLIPLPYPYTDNSIRVMLSKLKNESFFEKLDGLGMFRRV